MTETKSRKTSSVRNTIFGLTSQFLFLVLAFVCRTVLIKKLGTEVLGINALYSNILSILSLAELGIGNTLIFSLYKPLANNDDAAIASIMKYYKKLYTYIAIAVLVIGLALLPVLKFLISNDINISTRDLYIYYLLFLANSCFSYVMCYKQSLINADQKLFVIKIFNCIFYIILYGLQIACLFIFKNYIIHLSIFSLVTLFQNIALSIWADKHYSYTKIKNPAPIDAETKKTINHNIRSTFIYKLGFVLENCTDNILISVLVSTIAVGVYSNYNMLVGAVTGVINVFIYALYASVGNLSVENDPQKSYKIFNVLLLFFQYVGTFATICFFTVFNDFIAIWVGPEFLFDFKTVIVICVSFYFTVATCPIWIFRENFGLYKEVKYLTLATAIVNIGLSILLGIYWGILGILAATIIGRLLTNYSIEPFILFKKVFNKKPVWYFVKQIIIFVAMAGLGALLYFVYSFFPNGFGWIVLEILINLVVITSLFVLCTFKTEEFKYIKNVAKEYSAKIKSALKKRKKAEN